VSGAAMLMAPEIAPHTIGKTTVSTVGLHLSASFACRRKGPG
jgi:hypothetical protein